MNFVYPQFLWAFFCLLIPVIIHLFNFRRYKTIYFSRVKFLREVTEDSKSGTRLKHLLVLLSRLLWLSCLILAFAQPYVPASEGEKTENISSVYIDNSYSMQAEGQDGNLLNEAKNKAIELVKSFDNSEKINLITSDLLSVHHRYYTKGEILSMIREIDLSPKSTDLNTVLKAQSEILNEAEIDGNKRLFLFTDFQQETSKNVDFSSEDISLYYYQPKPEQSGNVFIDSVWFETPVHRLNSPVDVFFRVQNQTDNPLNDLSINLRINNNDPAPKRISVPANSFTEDKISFTDRSPGTKQGKLTINTNQLFFDDSFYFTYDIKESVRVLIVKGMEGDRKNLEQLYGLEDYYDASTTTIDLLTQEEVKKHEFIILQNVDKIPSGIMDLLDDALRNGASVCLIPGEQLIRDSWNNYLNRRNMPVFGSMDSVDQEISQFNYEDPLYKGVFESEPKSYSSPKVFNRYTLQTNSSQNYLSLFESGNGEPFLIYSKSFNGRLILMSSPLDIRYTNFQNHALFAATFLRFAETASFQKPLYMTIGKEQNYPLDQEINEKAPIHLVSEEFETDVIPQIINTNSSRYISFSHLEDAIRHAGFYRLTNEANFESSVALNFDRTESDMTLLEDKDIRANLENSGWTQVSALEMNSSGTIEINAIKATEYWRILLIFALIFILAEIALLKLWKT